MKEDYKIWNTLSEDDLKNSHIYVKYEIQQFHRLAMKKQENCGNCSKYTSHTCSLVTRLQMEDRASIHGRAIDFRQNDYGQHPAC